MNAINKGALEGLGLKHMVQQCGHDVGLTLRTDASAVRAVVERAGAGKVKHLSIKQL